MLHPPPIMHRWHLICPLSLILGYDPRIFAVNRGERQKSAGKRKLPQGIEIDKVSRNNVGGEERRQKRSLQSSLQKWPTNKGPPVGAAPPSTDTSASRISTGQAFLAVRVLRLIWEVK
jgi:hypothetical protein